MLKQVEVSITSVKLFRQKMFSREDKMQKTMEVCVGSISSHNTDVKTDSYDCQFRHIPNGSGHDTEEQHLFVIQDLCFL